MKKKIKLLLNYKKIPKKVKEDIQIDEYISNLKSESKLKKDGLNITIDELQDKVAKFVFLVNSGLYFNLIR